MNPDKTTEFRVFSGKVPIETSRHEKIELTENTAAIISEKETTIEELLPPPILTSPAHQKIIYSTDQLKANVKLTWESVPGAKSYNIEIARYRSFIDLVEDVGDWGSTNFTSKNLSEGVYYWRVNTVNSKGLKGAPSRYKIFMVSFSDEGLAAEGAQKPFLSVDKLRVMLGEEYYDTVFITGDTEPSAIIRINSMEVDVDRRGGFRMQLKNQLPGRRVYTIQSFGQNGAINFVQQDIHIER